MTVTIAQDTAIRANQSGWGTASDGEAWTHPIGAGTLSIASNELSDTNAGTGVDSMLLGTGQIINGDYYVRFSMTNTALDAAGFMVRYVDNNNFIRVQIITGHITVRLQVAGVVTTLTPNTGITLSNNTFYRAHLNITGNVYSCNVWLDGTTEPVGWVMQATDSGNNFIKPTQYGIFASIGVASDIVNHDSFLVQSNPPTIYVSPTGNDSTGDGSLGNPYATITKADANIGAGSTVNVLADTYTYAATANTLTNGTPLARIVWQASGAYGSAKLAGTMNNSDLWDVKGNYNDVVGFDVSGTLVKTALSLWGNHNRVWHCSAHDCGTSLASGSAGAGFFDYTGVTTVGTNEFGWCSALRCGPIPTSSPLYHGFYLSCNHDLLHDCICSNSGSYGFLLSGVNNAVIAHNTAFFNSYAGFALSGAAGTADFNTFENNISYNTNVPASGVLGNGYIIVNSPGGTHNVWTNNCSYLQGFLDYASVSSGSATITPVNPIHADPQFVNYQADGSGDYHLKATSPCIDAGIVNTVSTLDFDGNTRPRNYGYDLGAYECFGQFSAYDTAILSEPLGKPQAYYRLNDTTGTSAHDSSGNGYNGVLAGSELLGQVGAIVSDSDTSIYFGATDSLNVPYTLNYTTFSALSIIIWINTGAGWHQIAVTSVSTTTLTYYDGMLTVPGVAGPIEISSIFDWIGSYLAAYQAKVGIYNYVLTPTQILHYYTIGSGVTPGIYRVLINNTPVFVEAGTLNIDSTIGKRSTASFTVFLSDTSTHYPQYTPVAIYDGTNTLVFSGYISLPEEIKPGFQTTLDVQIQCIDQHFLADKRIVAASYVNRTHASIATDLLNNILSTEGVSIGHITNEESVVATLYPSSTLFPSTTLFPIGNAPGTLPTTTFAYCTVAQAMDALATAASVSGVPYYWSIDQNKQFWFVPYTFNYNSTLIDGTQIDDGERSGRAPSVKRQNPTYRNKQYILGGTALTVSQTETRKGDGTTTSWTMGYEIAQVPTVKVNGTTKTVGIKGIDTGKDFYWNGGDPTITQDSAGVVLISTDTLAVTYVGEYPTVIISQNDAQIGYQQSIDSTTGIVEESETDATITTLTDGYNKASYLLTRYGQQGILLQFMTLSTGFAAGQLVTVNLPDFGLNNIDMLIESVHASDQVDGFNIWFQVMAIVGPYDVTWSDFFKTLIAPAQSSTQISVGVSQVLALQQVFTGGITLSATFTATVAACPLPASTLFPSTTLFCC